MKRLIPILALGAALVGCALFTGCSTITPSFTQQTVYEGVSIGLSIYPQAEPEVRIAGEIICAEAAKTNISFEEITRDVDAAGLTNKNSKLIVQGALLAFNTAVNILGLQDQFEKQRPYLVATCAGINDALPPRPGLAMTARASKVANPKKPLPPHLH